MDYWKFDLQCPPEIAELLLAFLSDSDFESFQETDEGLQAFAPATLALQDLENAVSALAATWPFTWRHELIKGQNWNELWESNFQPVYVDDFCAVRAEFHEPIPGVEYELVIQPRMAFGSGHHETTWMCLKAMRNLPVAGSKLLDFGCGTGILAILASKLGAAEVEAIDIEEESYRNTLENSRRNQADNVIARHGVLADVQGTEFDGILANINRNVILDSFPRLFALLKPGGWLLCSGFLEPDESMLDAEAGRLGLKKIAREQKGKWICAHYAR